MSSELSNSEEKDGNKEKTFICHLCPASFTEQSSLDDHFIAYTQESFRWYIFQEEFSLKSQWNGLYSTEKDQDEDLEEKPLLCHICQKGFSYRSRLDIHIRTHTGEKPFECDVCDKRFSRKYNLDIHLRIHTKEKPFMCDICHKRFSQRCTLNRHRRIHTGEKTYTCNVCDKAFSQKSDLISHSCVFKGEKSFACDVCQKQFSGRYDLNKHLEFHTEEVSIIETAK